MTQRAYCVAFLIRNNYNSNTLVKALKYLTY